MWSRQNVSLSPSWIEEMDRARITMQKKQVSEWKEACEKVAKGEPLPPKPKRIELLPIEWWDKIHSSSSQLMKSLLATTLNTIPSLRAIANDVVFDVLMYLTPEFCETVLECVSTQIEDLYQGFQKVHPNFLKQGGQCSIIGHSLGSVIVWDLLSILQENNKNLTQSSGFKDNSQQQQQQQDGDGALSVPLTNAKNNDAVDVGYRAYAAKTDQEDVHAVKNGAWGPSLPKKMTHSIPFVPHLTIFVGSPLGLFLTLRGAHAVFDEMLQTATMDAKQKAEMNAKHHADYDELFLPVTSPFTLPSGSIYNIFHPSDPVAICDRYLSDTQLDFQMNFRDDNVTSRPLWKCLQAICPTPTDAFMLLIPVEESLRRSAVKNEPFPDGEAALQERLQFYQTLAAQENSYRVIDGLRPIDVVAAEINTTVFGTATREAPCR